MIRSLVRLLAGRVDVPLSRVARAAGLSVEVLRGARIEEVHAGPDRLEFKVMARSGAALPIDVLRAGSPEDCPTFRRLLEVLSPSLAVRRVAIEGDHAAVYLRVRSFGLAVTLDVLLQRGRARPTAASRARPSAPGPHATESSRQASESDGRARR